MNTLELGINIDHVATLRNARGTTYPDPIQAARLAEEAGADLITLHLREDRRHIKDADLFALRPLISNAYESGVRCYPRDDCDCMPNQTA